MIGVAVGLAVLALSAVQIAQVERVQSLEPVTGLWELELELREMTRTTFGSAQAGKRARMRLDGVPSREARSGSA